MQKRTVVVGAGLSGCVLAIMLAERGHQVSLYERRDDLRKQGKAGGRSINLAISRRGIRALEMIGVAESVLTHATPMYGREIYTDSIAYQPYGRDESEHQKSLSRAHLNCLLLDIAEQHDNIELYFSHKLEDLDVDKLQLQFTNVNTNIDTTVNAARVFAADGASSAVRQQLARYGLLSFEQEFLDHGYKEFTIHPDKSHHFTANRLHIWPRDNFMFIALPNADDSLTCTLFLPYEGEISFANLTTKTEVGDFLQTHFKEIAANIPDAADVFLSSPTGSMVTVRTDKWHYQDKILLVGDAAHAVVPFLGQGMNCAFEDCTALYQLLQQYDDDWLVVFAQFTKLRVPNANAIADMALDNYLEMRHLVASNTFLLRQAVLQALMQRYPNFLSKYNLIAFHDVPYAFAKQCGIWQEQLLDSLCVNLPSVDDIDWTLAESLMQEYFVKTKNWELVTE